MSLIGLEGVRLVSCDPSGFHGLGGTVWSGGIDDLVYTSLLFLIIVNSAPMKPPTDGTAARFAARFLRISYGISGHF